MATVSEVLPVPEKKKSDEDVFYQPIIEFHYKNGESRTVHCLILNKSETVKEFTDFLQKTIADNGDAGILSIDQETINDNQIYKSIFSIKVSEISSYEVTIFKV